jgi:hypothetical protein
MSRLFSLLLISSLFACSSSNFQVKSDYDRNADFDAYKTFAIGTVKMDEKRISEYDRARIVRAVETNLRSKGMKRDTSNPDVVLALYLDIESFKEQKASVGMGVGLGSYGYYGGANVAVGGSVPIYDTGEKGHLVIDIIETQEMNLVWRGQGNKTLDPSIQNKDFDEQDKRLQKVIDYLMAGYPPEIKASNK